MLRSCKSCNTVPFRYPVLLKQSIQYRRRCLLISYSTVQYSFIEILQLKTRIATEPRRGHAKKYFFTIMYKQTGNLFKQIKNLFKQIGNLFKHIVNLFKQINNMSEQIRLPICLNKL